jgi:hypothetical protein
MQSTSKRVLQIVYTPTPETVHDKTRVITRFVR